MSGLISGRKSLDGSSLSLISGRVTEIGGGLYAAILNDFDTSGNTIGLLFTCSGSVPVTLTVTTVGNISGYVWTASGQFAVANSGLRVVANSGLGVIAQSGLSAISTVYSGMLSGQQVTARTVTDKSGYQLVSGSLSGQPITLLSGRSYTASGQWATANSGLSVAAFIASGALSGQKVDAFKVDDKAGYSLLSGSLSGQPITLLSGRSWLASGNHAVANSGLSVVTQSGVQAVAIVYSGSLSGQQVTARTVTDKAGYTVSSGSLSGQPVTLLSGRSWLASGNHAVANSGVFANATATLGSGALSGQLVSLFSGSLSGFQVTARAVTDKTGYTLSSGSLSGQKVELFSGNVVTVLSGQTWLASGSLTANAFASGLLTREIPERVLKVDMSGVTSEAARSPLNALRKLMNKWDAGVTASGKLTVFKEDDSTQAYAQAIGSTSGASAVTSLDTD